MFETMFRWGVERVGEAYLRTLQRGTKNMKIGMSVQAIRTMTFAFLLQRHKTNMAGESLERVMFVCDI